MCPCTGSLIIYGKVCRHVMNTIHGMTVSSTIKIQVNLVILLGMMHNHCWYARGNQTSCP